MTLPNLLFIRQMHAAEYSLEELMLRMWYVSGQNDPSIELVTPWSTTLSGIALSLGKMCSRWSDNCNGGRVFRYLSWQGQVTCGHGQALLIKCCMSWVTLYRSFLHQRLPAPEASSGRSEWQHGKQIVNAFPSILNGWMDRNLKLSLV